MKIIKIAFLAYFITAIQIVVNSQQSNTEKETVKNLRCEFLITPLGIDNLNPALSWNINDESRGVVQTSYQVLVASTATLLAKGNAELWNSGEIASDKSQFIIYKGKPLVSRLRCYWKVIVKTKSADGVLKTYTSEPSWWEMGLLSPADWKASWIQSSDCKPIENELVKSWMEMSLLPQEFNNRVIMKDTNLWKPARLKGREILGAILPVPAFRTEFEVTNTIKNKWFGLSGIVCKWQSC